MLKVVFKCNFSVFCQNTLGIFYLKFPNLQLRACVVENVFVLFKGEKVCCNESCKKCPALYRDSLGWNKVAQMCKYHSCNTVVSTKNNSNSEF